jgi:hypothetical protein
MAKMNIKIDKELDLMTAYVQEDKLNKTELEIYDIDDYNILLHVDPTSKEVVYVQIYDFSIIKRKLIRHLIFLITKGAIRNWLAPIIESFKINKPQERFAH